MASKAALRCSLARLHPANSLASASDPFYMESVTTTRYAGIWFPSALLARTLSSPLGLTFRILNFVIPGLANCCSRLGSLHLSSVYGTYWKLALIRGNLLSQTTAHTVVWSLRPPLLQQNTSMAFIFPHLLMVRSHLLLGTVHITIWRSFGIILVRVLVLYCGVL